MWRELNAAAVSAGLTAFVWYACGALPLQLAVTDALELSSGSVFIVWRAARPLRFSFACR